QLVAIVDDVPRHVLTPRSQWQRADATARLTDPGRSTRASRELRDGGFAHGFFALAIVAERNRHAAQHSSMPCFTCDGSAVRQPGGAQPGTAPLLNEGACLDGVAPFD